MMEATFVLGAQENRKQFADRLTTLFTGKTIRVRVEELESPANGQQELLRRMQALRLETEKIPVPFPPGIDVNDLIDSVNDVDLNQP